MKMKVGTSRIQAGQAIAVSASLLVSAAAFSVVGWRAPGSRTPVSARQFAARSVPKLSWKGTITMWAQAYTPDVPGIKLAPGSPKLHALANIASQFEKLYPGIHIRFISPSAWNGSNETLLPKASTGSMYDVYFDQFGSWNTQLPSGIVYNLMPYLKQPNPYIPGNKRWISVMNPYVVSETELNSHVDYEVNGDWVSFAFYYNKALFRKAGITDTPKTWAELLADCRRLKAHGIIPGADIPRIDWYTPIALGNYLGIQALKKMVSFSSAKGITNYDEAIAYKKGILNPLKNPRVMAWWPLFRTLFTKYWDPAVSAIPINATPPNAVNGQSLFEAGKVAMIINGSWVPTEVPKRFPLGSFPFPGLYGTSKYSTLYNGAGDVNNPGAAFQYGISTPKADKSMAQPGKFQAVLDWLRFLATPQHDQAVVNELGAFIPTFKGTVPIKVFRSQTSLVNKPLYKTVGGEYLSSAGDQALRSLFQEYVTGHISFTAAKQQYGSLLAAAVQQFLAKNKGS